MRTWRRSIILCGLMLALILILGGLDSSRRSVPVMARVAAPQESGGALVSGNIGGYLEGVDQVSLAVEANGRVHVLWTGKLNPHFPNYLFYSTSGDGVNWTPYQILNYWNGAAPHVVVDNAHQRAHLMYSSSDGLVHHTATAGTLSQPVVVAQPHYHFLQGFPLPSGGIGWPAIAVADQTGYAYLVWREGTYHRAGASYPYRYRTWHAYWDGSSWTAPQWVINDEDTFYSSIAAAPDGRVMLAWFQGWQRSLGDGTSPGDPIVPRTAHGGTPGSYGLRQAAHELYPLPERDESILLAFAPGADAFIIVCDHAMWPGHSRVYRYLWQDGAWTGPLDVAQNTSGRAVPSFVGAATDQPLIRHVYVEDGITKMRTEVNGVLSPPQSVADYLANRGYTGAPKAYFADRAGDLHSVVMEESGGVSGFYYVRP